MKKVDNSLIARMFQCATALFLCLSLSGLTAQPEYSWTGEKYMEKRDYRFENGQRNSEPYSITRIWFTGDGQDSIAEWTMGDTMSEKVHSVYNWNRDLIERHVQLNDKPEMVFTWRYKYDSTGLMKEEIAFDANQKLISQQIMAYDEKGRLAEHAAFVQKDLTFQAWGFEIFDRGYPIVDALYLPYSRNYYRFDWKKRHVFKPIEPFSPQPSDVVFVRYQYQYNSSDQLTGCRRFDQFGKQLATIDYKYDKSGNPNNITITGDSTLFILEFRYNDSGDLAKVNQYEGGGDKDVIYGAEYDYDSKGRMLLKEDYKPGIYYETRVYTPNGLTESRELRNLFREPIERHSFDKKGRITEVTYLDGETQEPYIYSEYRYE